jgi:hypothetical protein
MAATFIEAEQSATGLLRVRVFNMPADGSDGLRTQSQIRYSLSAFTPGLVCHRT